MDLKRASIFAFLLTIFSSTFEQVQCQAKKSNSTGRPRKTPRPAKRPVIISSTTPATTTTTDSPTTIIEVPTTTDLDNSTVSVNFTLKSGNAVLVMVVDVVDYNDSTIVTKDGPIDRKGASILPHMRLNSKGNRGQRITIGADEGAFDLRGSENRLSPDSIGSPTSVANESPCFFEGSLKCRDPRVTCKGYGEIDCENYKKCNVPSTMSCNMDLNRGRCTGRGSCKRPTTISPSPAKISLGDYDASFNDQPGHQHSIHGATLEVPTASTFSTTETTIVAIAITLGLAVLAGTIAFVYVSADKLKIRPCTSGTTVLSASSTRSSRMASTDSNIS